MYNFVNKRIVTQAMYCLKHRFWLLILVAADAVWGSKYIKRKHVYTGL